MRGLIFGRTDPSGLCEPEWPVPGRRGVPPHVLTFLSARLLAGQPSTRYHVYCILGKVSHRKERNLLPVVHCPMALAIVNLDIVPVKLPFGLTSPHIDCASGGR